MGVVPESGLKLRQEFAGYDAEVTFEIKPEAAIEPKGCLCGEILRGVKTPADCRLFRKVCTPENPVGPCMVSSEGNCSAYYLYGE
jgi:hydrogenase expression/formation protein HypD